MAWTFINDSLCTMLCLQWEPEIIAIALMHLAEKLCRFKVVDWINREKCHSYWWDMYIEGITIDLLEDICHQLLDVYCLESTSSKSIEENTPKISDKNENSLIDNCANANFSKDKSFLSKQLKLTRKKSRPYKKEIPKSLPNCDSKHSQNEYNVAEKTQNNFKTFALNKNPDWLDSKFWETLQSIKAVGKTSSQGLTNIIIQQNIVTTSCNFQVSTLKLEHCASKINTSLGHNFTGDIYKPSESPNTTLCNKVLNSQPSSFNYTSFKTSAEVVASNTSYNKPLLASNDLSEASTFSKILPPCPVGKVSLQMIQSHSTIGQTSNQCRNVETPRDQPAYPQLYPYNKYMHQTGILKLCSTDVPQNNIAVTTQSLPEFVNLRTEIIPHNSKENSYLSTYETPVSKNTELSYTTNSNLFMPNTEQHSFGGMVFKNENEFSCDRNYYQIENRSLESTPFENSYSTKTFQPASTVSLQAQNPYLGYSFHINQDPSSYQASHPISFRSDVQNNSYCQNLNTNTFSSAVYPEQNYMFEEYFHSHEFSPIPQPVTNHTSFSKKPVPSKGLLPTPQPPIREFDYNFDDNAQMY